MRARIVKEFHDKHDYRKVYKVDDLVDFSESRFNELHALGLVESSEETSAIKEPASEVETTVNPEQKQERKRRARKND